MISLSICVIFFSIVYCTTSNTTERPIIGILTTPMPSNLANMYENFTEIVEGKNTHFIEGGSGRLFPVSYKWSKEEMQIALYKLNGIFISDSNAQLLDSNGNFTIYANAVKMLLEISKDINNNGAYFPVWGTSRGFEAMMMIEYGESSIIRRRKNSEDYVENLLEISQKSKLFGSFTSKQRNALETGNIVYFDHEFLIRKSDIKSDFQYDITSYVKIPDYDAIAVGSIEGKKYPFYGVQYNPGSWLYEWKKQKVVKTTETIFLSYAFANFFIEECKKNGQGFENYAEELKNIIESHYHVVDKEYGYIYLIH